MKRKLIPMVFAFVFLFVAGSFGQVRPECGAGTHWDEETKTCVPDGYTHREMGAYAKTYVQHR